MTVGLSLPLDQLGWTEDELQLLRDGDPEARDEAYTQLLERIPTAGNPPHGQTGCELELDFGPQVERV